MNLLLRFLQRNVVIVIYSHIESFNGKLCDGYLNQHVFCPRLTPGAALKGGEGIITRSGRIAP